MSHRLPVGVADGIAVGVGRGFQVAAARGVVVDIIIIGIGRERAAADLGRGGLTPDIIREVIILVLRRAAAVGLAVELRQTAAGIGVADRRNAGALVTKLKRNYARRLSNTGNIWVTEERKSVI